MVDMAHLHIRHMEPMRTFEIDLLEWSPNGHQT